MKSISVFPFAIAAFFLFTGVSFADETYSATLTGVDCDGCKKTIARSLAKIEGVKVIRIVKNGDGTHRMTVTTENGTVITGKQASEAIKHAEHYQIKSWTKNADSETASGESA